jgi:predicted nucleic acid-binding protein
LEVILDTNALSAVADDEPAVVSIYREAPSMELPAIVLGEYRFGIGQSRRRGEYEKWLRAFVVTTFIAKTTSGRSRFSFTPVSLPKIRLCRPSEFRFVFQ